MASRIPLLCLLLLLAACATTPGDPAPWPVVPSGRLVGKCPDIAGKYMNAGSRHPGDARPLLLSQFLGIDEAHTVEVRQAPDTIRFLLRTSGESVRELVFRSGETGAGWERRPGTFLCPLDVAGGRRSLYFSHQGSQSFSGMSPLLIANAIAFRWHKADDGALVVNVIETSGALIVLVPVGKTERVWYRYAPAD